MGGAGIDGGGGSGTSDARERRTLALVLLCFFLSGFAALLYETVWTRQFAFVFGTSDLAVATVLAGYMGGLALGAALAARWVERVRRPVLVYGLLELGVALAASAVPWAIGASTRLALLLFGGADSLPPADGAAIALFYLACSFLILLVPTALMGATLPLLARSAVQRDEQVGPRIGLLYGTNTVGAVGGTLVAAWLLLPALGMAATVAVGVGLNALVFVIAAWASRAGTPAAAASASSATAAAARAPDAAPEASPAAGAAHRHRRWVLPLILVSGSTSFFYEVLWVRLLGHVLGGSTYAFATMLASFLLGLALGSAVASRLATSPDRAARWLAVAELGIAACSLLAFVGVGALPALAEALGADAGGGLLAQGLLAALVLLPGALFIGATYPLAVRVLAEDERDAAPVSARVYAFNTVGAIAGSVGAGFVVIPALGYETALAAAVGVNLVLGAAAALLLVRPVARGPALAAVAGLLALLVVRPGPPWAILSASSLGLQSADPSQVGYLGVGRSATVLLVERPAGWQLRVNGLPESIIRRRGAPRLGGSWLCSLPVMARPETRSMLVIGFGGGSHLEVVPRSVRSIDVVELEPEVIAANRTVGALRDIDPLADPRMRLCLNDARGALLLTDRRYDAIVSQPSHPWTAGASHLYTRDFFELVREHLTPGGVFLQWIHLEFLDEELLGVLVATLAEAFPQVRVYRPLERTMLLLLGSELPFDMLDSVPRAVAAAPDDLAREGVFGPEDVEAALALDDAGARAFAAGAPLCTDDRNRMQTHSPRVLAGHLDAARADALLQPFDPLRAPPPGLDRLLLVRRMLYGLGDQGRIARLADAWGDRDVSAVARGLLASEQGRSQEALAMLEAVLARSPGAAAALEARAALARLQRPQLVQDDPRVAALLASLDEASAAVVAGWRLAEGDDPAAGAALDERLAAVDVRHPLYGFAARLRADWRLQGGDPEQADAALRLIDVALALRVTPLDLLLRTAAADAAGEDVSALLTLGVLADSLRQQGNRGALVQQALELLDGLSLHGDDLTLRDRLRARLVGAGG